MVNVTTISHHRSIWSLKNRKSSWRVLLAFPLVETSSDTVLRGLSGIPDDEIVLSVIAGVKAIFRVYIKCEPVNDLVTAFLF